MRSESEDSLDDEDDGHNIVPKEEGKDFFIHKSVERKYPFEISRQ